MCWSGGTPKEDLVCNKNSSLNKHLCLPLDYNKFDLPFPNNINIIDIGIDIVDVLRINDKVLKSKIYKIKIILVAPGALAHRLQCCTAC